MAENICYVCNKKLSASFFSSDANKCKACGHNVCNSHYKDGHCTYCREKMGKK